MWHSPQEIPAPGFVVIDSGDDFSIARVWRESHAVVMMVELGRDVMLADAVRWSEIPPDCVRLEDDGCLVIRIH